MVVEGLLSDAAQKTSGTFPQYFFSRHTRRNCFPYRSLATKTKVKWQSQQTCKLCTDSGKY